MLLNREEIAQRGLVVGGAPGYLRDAGYDLRISRMFGKTPEGKSESHDDDLDLTPQGIAAVISMETIKLPPDVCAHASVKTSLCREGILAINIGIIDPGWEGPISSVLLNFGKDGYRLKSGDPFLRLTFHTLKPPTSFVQSAPKDRVAYETEIRQKFDKRLAESFMDLEKAAAKGSKRFTDDLRNTLLKYVPIGVIVIALTTFFLNWGILAIASRAMPFDVVQLRAQALVGDLQKQTDDLKTENKNLRKHLDEVQAALDKLTKKK